MYNKKVLYKKRQKVTNHRQSMEQRKRNKKEPAPNCPKEKKRTDPRRLGTDPRQKRNRPQILLEKSQALCYSTIELKKYLEEKG